MGVPKVVVCMGVVNENEDIYVLGPAVVLISVKRLKHATALCVVCVGILHEWYIIIRLSLH